MDDIDYDKDAFSDIIAKDDRYAPNAYALLMDAFCYLCDNAKGRHVKGEDILAEFRERALDLYGPMTFCVLTEWGVTCCEDIGEMMFNLTDSGRVKKNDDDTPEAFAGGYDFKETFLGPYTVD
ncbi:MAG: hypothetical protein E7049_10430 [Lentisphaerae bacterium]|nr:hypothetical protein [Lentisphaerota bacterium]